MKKRHGVLAMLGAVSVITFLDRLAIAVSGPSIQKEMHISPERWGWILSAYVFAYGIFEIPSGVLGDKFGQRRELTRITVWWSFFTALTAWCHNFIQLISARFFFGIGAAGAYPNISGVLARWFPLREHARGQGLVWAMSRLGGALAPLILVPLQIHYGWRTVFWLLGLLGLAWAIVWRAWFHDNPADQPGITPQELAEIGSGQAYGQHDAHWAALLRVRQLWLIILAYGLYAWASWFYFSWFPVWMVHGAHFSIPQMGIYAAFPFLLGIAGNLVGGWLSDELVIRFGTKYAYRWVTTVCLLLTSVLLLAMSMVHTKTWVVILSSAGFGVMDLMLPSAWAMCMSIGGPFGGTATGMMNTSGQVGGLMCTVLFGYIVHATGSYNLPLHIVALMVLLSALVFSRIDCTAGLNLKVDASG
ncbi:MAG: MFS transporter [Acidobacteriaceae bacterium]